MKLEIKTKRLLITPFTDEAMAAVAGTDDGCQARYEMYQAHPGKEQIWYVCWQIALRDGTPVGQIAFGGAPDADKTVRIGWYFIEEAYRGNGYAAEALHKISNFAFSKRVDTVIANPAAENTVAVYTLEAAGFAQCEDGDGVLCYAATRPATTWTSTYMCIGMALGMLIGQRTGNMTTGMCVGMMLGVSVGVSLDTADKRSRKHKKKKEEQKDDS